MKVEKAYINTERYKRLLEEIRKEKQYENNIDMKILSLVIDRTITGDIEHTVKDNDRIPIDIIGEIQHALLETNCDYGLGEIIVSIERIRKRLTKK